MQKLAIVLVACATACTPKPAFVDTGGTPVASCGAAINCAEGGGQGPLLVPFGVLLAAAVGFAIAIYVFEPVSS